MSGLAEEHQDDSPTRVWLLRGAVALSFVALVLLGTWALKNIKGGEGPKRQIAKISLLPDQPPPPPPKEEKKPEPPKDEPKQQMREEPLKQADAPKPANEPIKMEGAAGDGPSAFAGGNVSKEYSGGTPATGAAQSGGSGGERAQERFFANSAKQMLRDAIERHLKSESTQATAEFKLWVARDGGISRFELASSGDTRLDAQLNSALDETALALKLPPPPPGMAQPMKFRLQLRPLG